MPAIPETLLIVGAIALLLIPPNARYIYGCALLLLVVAFACQDQNPGLDIFQSMDPTSSVTTFSGMFVVDCFIKIQKIVLCVWGLIYLLITHERNKNVLTGVGLFSFLIMLVGGMCLLSANDFRTLFLGSELLAFATIAFLNSNDKNLTFKVFIIQGVGSALYLFGSAILYGVSQTTDFSLLISKLLETNPSAQYNPFVCLAIILILLGGLTKMLFVPFHSVFMETSEKEEWPIFTAINFISSTVYMSVLMRLFVSFNCDAFKPMLLIIGELGMGLGFLNALRQSQIRNIIASQTIGTAGMLLVGFGVSYSNIVSSGQFILFMHGLSCLAVYACVSFAQRHSGPIVTVSHLATVRSRSPVTAVVLGFSVLNLMNMPPFPGFIPLLFFAKNLIEERAFITLGSVMLCKIMCMYVGIKIVKSLMICGKGSRVRSLPIAATCTVAVLICAMVLAGKVFNTFMLSETALKCYEYRFRH
jgi:NADH:ubiquinone oxidoreductase subunit 2 (subunit N)